MPHGDEIRLNSDFSELLEAFNAAGVEYLLIGGMAFGFHAEPRYTKDLDLWIRPTRENADRAFAALRTFGAPLSAVSPSGAAPGAEVTVTGLGLEKATISFGSTPATVVAASATQATVDTCKG